MVTTPQQQIPWTKGLAPPAGDPALVWAPEDKPDADSRSTEETPLPDRHVVATQRRRPAYFLAGIVVLAAALVGGSYVVGHSPVSGLNRRISTLNGTVAAQTKTISVRDDTIASDANNLSAVRGQLAAASATATACQTAIGDANNAFQTVSSSLTALSNLDFATSESFNSLLGTQMTTYRSDAASCNGFGTMSVRTP